MKAERKYLAHYLDAAFDPTYAAAEYVRLGKDLEEFSVELNPDVTTSKNILGENSVTFNGYEASGNVEPFYYEAEDALAEKLMQMAMLRESPMGYPTSYVEVLLKPGANDSSPVVVRAVREDVYVVPTSYGGDTSGVQVPFEIRFGGNRVEGAFDLSTKKFSTSNPL